DPEPDVLPVSVPGGARQARFEAVYERLRPSLVRYLDRLTGDQDAAEDVAQEAFTRLLARPDLGEEAARLWVFTVATNLVRDRGRAAARRKRLLQAVPPRQPTEPAADERLEREQRIAAVRAALDQLP